MAYPASTKTLQTWVQEIDHQCTLLKGVAQQQKAASQAGTLDVASIVRFFDLLVQSNNFFTQVAGVSGIANYAKTEKGDDNLNPVTEFQAMQAEVVDTLTWIRTNLPSDTFGGKTYALGYELPANNTSPSVILTFTPAQSATYRTQLDALIATIS